MEGEEEMVGGLMRIKNGQILRGGEFVDGELFVDLDTGLFVEPPTGDIDPNIFQLDASGLLVAPGYIDIQNNGSFGVDLSPQLRTGAEADLKRFVYSEGGFSFRNELFPMGSDHVPNDPKGMYWPRAQEEMSDDGNGSSDSACCGGCRRARGCAVSSSHPI